MDWQRIRTIFMRAPVARQRFASSRTIALVSLIAILGLAGCGLAFTIFALEIQSGARAYVTGNGLWSKAHIQATYHLTRYSHSGDPEDLQQARRSLAVPLNDLRGRLALDAEPPDLEAAREAFLAGNNHPDDVSKIIWLYRYFADYLFFQDAVQIWRESDRYILTLERIADELAAAHARPDTSEAELAALRQQLFETNRNLRPLDMQFADTLASGSRWLNEFLIAISFLVLIIVTGGAAIIFIWATRSIASSENKFRATFQHAAVGMAQLRPDEHFMDVNDSLCNILQRTREDLLQTNLNDITYVVDRGDDSDDFRALLQAEIEGYVIEKRLLRADGKPVWCKLTLSRIGDYMNLPRYLIVVVEDISEQRRLSSELSHQATHDALTGIINRVEFENRLAEAIRDAIEKDNRHTLCFIDLDQFKVVNDTCGHIAGDELLRQVTETLGQQLRRGDVLARLGGDEFGIIFTECNIEAAEPVAQKLRTALSGFSFLWESATFNITASMGLVEINATAGDASSLLKAADTACYSAKDQGRNHIHVYKEGDLALAVRRNEMEWVSRIRNAIVGDKLRLAAQCIQSLQQPETKRYELLVRLVDTDGKLVLPGLFLPAAERYNVVTLIDRWVVDAALATLRENPVFLDQAEAIHINLSGQSISRDEFLQHVIGLLDHYDLDNEKLCFEITETAAVSSLIEARHFIDTLKARGCRFALDDFGSGLSSFGYLRSLPVDIVKIDGSFVRNMNDDEVHLAMVRSIAEIGRIMNKQTIAEFVDSVEILAALKDLGIDYAQGYYIHQPCLLSELLDRKPTEQTHTVFDS